MVKRTFINEGGEGKQKQLRRKWVDLVKMLMWNCELEIRDTKERTTHGLGRMKFIEQKELLEVYPF